MTHKPLTLGQTTLTSGQAARWMNLGNYAAAWLRDLTEGGTE